MRLPRPALALVLLAATAAQAGEGLRVPDAAAVWPQWQLRMSRPQDPVSLWRHEAWWGGAGAATASGGGGARSGAPRLSPAADRPSVAVAQSGF